MDFEVAWTGPALADLESIVRHVAVDNPVAAERLRQDLIGSVEVLARFPFIGPVYERDPSGRAREVLCRPYRVFSRVVEESSRVEVLMVWHSSRQEPRISG